MEAARWRSIVLYAHLCVPCRKIIRSCPGFVEPTDLQLVRSQVMHSSRSPVLLWSMNSLHLLFRYATIATSIVIPGARCALASASGKKVIVDFSKSHRGEAYFILSRVMLQRNHGPRHLCADQQLCLVPLPVIMKRQGVREDHRCPYCTTERWACQK